MRASLGMVRNPFTVPGVPSVTIRRSVNVTVYPCRSAHRSWPILFLSRRPLNGRRRDVVIYRRIS